MGIEQYPETCSFHPAPPTSSPSVRIRSMRTHKPIANAVINRSDKGSGETGTLKGRASCVLTEDHNFLVIRPGPVPKLRLVPEPHSSVWAVLKLMPQSSFK